MIFEDVRFEAYLAGSEAAEAVACDPSRTASPFVARGVHDLAAQGRILFDAHQVRVAQLVQLGQQVAVVIANVCDCAWMSQIEHAQDRREPCAQSQITSGCDDANCPGRRQWREEGSGEEGGWRARASVEGRALTGRPPARRCSRCPPSHLCVVNLYAKKNATRQRNDAPTRQTRTCLF